MPSPHCSARQQRLAQPIDVGRMQVVMSRLFPKRSNYSAMSWEELPREMARFGITTRADFTRLMKRHRRALIAIDRDPLSPREVGYFKREYGEAFVRDALRRQYWFAWQALVRTAMELEFGEAAAVRDDPDGRPQTAV